MSDDEEKSVTAPEVAVDSEPVTDLSNRYVCFLDVAYITIMYRLEKMVDWLIDLRIFLVVFLFVAPHVSLCTHCLTESRIFTSYQPLKQKSTTNTQKLKCICTVYILSDVCTKYQEASKVVNLTLEGLVTQTIVGAKVLDLCAFGTTVMEAATSKLYTKKVNGKAIDRGVAFPVCVSVNDIVCNFSPLEGLPEVTVSF